MKCYYCEKQAIDCKKVTNQDGEVKKIYLCPEHLTAMMNSAGNTPKNPLETLLSICNAFIGIGIGLFVLSIILLIVAPVIVGLSLLIASLILTFSSFVLRKIFEVVRYYCETKGIKMNTK